MKYIEPHHKKSRDVEDKDIERVLEDAVEMLELAQHPPKGYEVAVAVAHSQFVDDDPLRFFVTADERIIVNPYIVSRAQKPAMKPEGCTSFPKYRHIQKVRFYRVAVIYLEFEYDTDDKIMLVARRKSVTGKEARMFQHEVEHMEGILLYPIDEDTKE